MPSPLKSHSCEVAFVDVEVNVTAKGAPPLSGIAVKLATGGSLLGLVPPESSPPPPPASTALPPSLPYLLQTRVCKHSSFLLNK